ncbi:MAG: glycosyltransferase family 4 protein [Oscillochloridaceae bacterium umkhey_bin13]
MRLCLVSLDFAPVRSSGLTIYAERLAARLVAHGHDVTVIAARRSGTQARTVRPNLVVERVTRDRSDWIGYSLRAARHVERLSQEQPFEVVHFLDVHFAWAYRQPYVASLLQSFRQRLTADNGRPYGSSWANRSFRQVYYGVALRLLERPALQRASALVSLSEATRTEFVTHYGIAPERIVLAPESVDPDQFAPQPAAAVAELRQHLGLHDQPVLLYIGFSTPRKGLEYLAAALANLPPEVRLLIIGQWEPGYRERVMAAAGAAWSRVRELGSVPDAALPLYLSLADLVVLPSLLEGFGLPALESLACGTPVVAAASGSLPEVVGPCGVIVPPRDSQALASAIRDLLADPARRAQLGVSARERALTVFGPDRSYTAMLRAYTAVAAISTAT